MVVLHDAEPTVNHPRDPDIFLAPLYDPAAKLADVIQAGLGDAPRQSANLVVGHLTHDVLLGPLVLDLWNPGKVGSLEPGH